MIAVILLLPLIIVVFVLLSITALLLGKKRLAFCLLLAALLLNLYGESFPLNVRSAVNRHKVLDGGLAFTTFNIHSSGDDFVDNYEKVVSQLISSGSDVVLLNECQSMNGKVSHVFDSLMRMTFQFTTCEGDYHDNAFYSKYPIVSSESVQAGHGNSFPTICIDVGGDVVRIIGCHMNSNNYVDSQTRLSPENIRTKESAKLYWETLKKGSQMRIAEADSIRRSITDASGVIILGDMNDVGGSSPLRKLQSMGLKDAWWMGGIGLGGTRSVLFYPFRIDHILYGRDFELMDVSLTDQGLSDHKQLTARFKIKKKNP